MINLSLPLIGPAALVLSQLRVLPAKHPRVSVLCHGSPGSGKSHLLDQLAAEITGSEFAVETVNGQSLSVDLVRQWRERSRSGKGRLETRFKVYHVPAPTCAEAVAYARQQFGLTVKVAQEIVKAAVPGFRRGCMWKKIIVENN